MLSVVYVFRSSDCINALPSPRLLNSHYPITWLPKQMEDKRTKLIHMIRNPKDIAVSFFYQIKTLNYEFEDEPPFVTFSEFLPYITGEYGVCKYSKTCLKRPPLKKTKIGFQYRLSLNAGQKNCRMLQDSAILSTSIKLPFVIKIFLLSILEWLKHL